RPISSPGAAGRSTRHGMKKTFNRSKQSRMVLLLCSLCLLLFNSEAANVVHFSLADFRNMPVTNRFVLVTPLAIEPPANTIPALDIVKYGQVTNEFWVTNMMAGT